MIKSIIALLMASTISHAWSCEIKLFERVLIVNSTKSTPNDFIQKTDCSNQVVSQFFNFVKNGNGMLYSNLIKENLDSSEQVVITPHKINVSQLNDLVNNQLFADEERKIVEIKSLTNLNAIQLSQDDVVNVTCSNCSKGGPTSFTIEKRDVLGDQSSLFQFTATVGVRTHLLVSSQNVSSFRKFESDVPYKEVIAYVADPNKYVHSLEEVRFMQNVRPLEVGNYLERTALMPYAIVKPGESIRVISKSANMQIETNATSTENGFLNQTIRLRNTKSNIIFNAKIVDKGLARIDL